MPRTKTAGPGLRSPAEWFTVTAACSAVPGTYWRRPAGSSWPSVTPPTMTSTKAVVAAAVCRIRPPSPTPYDGNKAHCQGTEHDRLQDAGMSEGHFEVLAGEDPLADYEAHHGNQQRHREHQRRRHPGLGTPPRRLVGVAAKVDRIIPVTYSEVMARPPSAASSTAPTNTIPKREQAVGSNIWRCPAVIFDHCWTWESTEDRPQGNRDDKSHDHCSPGGRQGAQLNPL